MTNDTNENETTPTTYVEMLDQYVKSQEWIGPGEAPLVFHARKLAAQLDAQIEGDGSTLAAKDSAYLQAIERLNKRRGGTVTVSTTGEMPGQSDVFDFLD